MFGCVWVHVVMKHMHVEGKNVIASVFLCSSSVFSGAGSLYLEYTNSASLARQLVLGIPCLCRPSAVVTGGHPACLSSVLMLRWKTFYPLSHLPSPKILIKFTVIKKDLKNHSN